MDIYIDKDHLFSFVRRASDSRFSKVNDALKEDFNIHFLFPKGELIPVEGENYETHETKLLIMKWVTSMSSGVGSAKILWKEKLPNKVNGTDDKLDVLSKNQLCSVYWIKNNMLFDKYDNNRIIYAEIGEEIDSISSLLIKNCTKQLEIRKMKSWKDISSYTSPCSDIILVDQYIFSSPEIYQYNILGLLKILAAYGLNCMLNIVIFTTPYSIGSSNSGKKIRIDHDWCKILGEIKSYVYDVTKKIPNITLVLSSDINEHDRLLFTNYKGFFSGDTYNYFDSNYDVISKGRFLDIYSFIDPEYLDHWMTFVSDMQQKVNEVNKINSDNIIGDKKCHFLTFPIKTNKKIDSNRHKLNKSFNKKKK